MKKIFLFLLACANFTLANSQTTDQQNIGANSAYHIINSGNEISKQTFKAGLSGKLTTVNIDMEIGSCTQISNMNVNINVYDSTGNNLIGTAVSTFNTPTARGMHPFNFTNPIYLLANRTYAFVITVPSGQLCDTPSVSANIRWYYGIDDITYPNGTAYYNYSPTGFDYYFSTELMVCSNPINGYISVIGFETCQSGNGSIICNTTGGVGPFTYLWNNAATDSALVNLSQGNYSVTVSDGANCGDHDFYYLFNAGTAVTTWDTATTVNCFGMCNASASISVLSGVAPYSYVWNTSDTTASLTNLCAGQYIYTVTDINNCSFTDTLIVGSPNEITASFIVTNETCVGGNGFIDMNPIGDFPPFTYSWTHGPTTEDVNSLTAGFYQVIITDNNGCSQVIGENVFMDQPASINAAALDIQNNLCFQSNGHITNLGTAVITDNPPLTYTLDAQPLSSIGAFNLLSGSYLLEATDAAGCTDTALITIQDIGSPISVGQGSTFHPICPDACNGTAQVGVAGGNLPYSYEWSNGLTVANGMNLCPGEYTVVVTDADGCTGSTVITVNEPSPININFSVNDATCGLNDGDALATVTSGGTAPFTFSWSNGDDTNFADSLSAGNYSISVKDANQCQVYRIISVNNFSGPTVTGNILNASCNGFSNGGIDLTITGGSAPIQIQWSTGHTTEDLSSLAAGVYDVTVSDASGCIINKSYQVLENTPITITPSFTLPACGSSDGEISVLPMGGAAPYSYQWDANTGNAITQVVSNLAAGVYEVTVTDVAGCAYTFAIGLSNVNSPVINVDEVIRPNCQTGGGNIFITATGGTAPYNYQWSNGAISADLQNVSEGIYSLNVTDAANCQANISFDLPGINIFAQEICMITVDSITNMNQVVWEKTEGIGIAEFKIYRQTNAPNFFLHVGTVPFDSLSIFNDTVASSDIHAWKYKLATVDSCGNESDFIASHKSIHLITELTLTNDVLLEWDDYIGFSYPEFYINRHHISTGWEVIDTVPNNIHSYLDTNPPVGNVGYSITVPAPSDCLPTRVGVNTSRSNVKNQPIASPAGVEEESLLSFSLFPNPANSTVQISLSNYNGEKVFISIYNAIGELVFTENMNSSNRAIDLKEFASGLYTIQISTDKVQKVNKLIIQK